MAKEMAVFESDRQEDLYTATEEQTAFDSDIRVLLDTAAVRREQFMNEIASLATRDTEEILNFEKKLIDEIDAMLLLLEQRTRDYISQAERQRQTVQNARMPVIGPVADDVATRCAVVDDILASQARAEQDILQICDEISGRREDIMKAPGMDPLSPATPSPVGIRWV